MPNSSGAPFDIVFASLENWDEIWRRNQFICALWSGRHPKQQILFVTPPRVLPLALKNRDFASLGEKWHSPPGFSNVHVFRPLRLIPNTLPLLRAFNDWHERGQIRAAMRKQRIIQPILWLNSHYARHFVGKLSEKALIYDITDDWIALRQTPARRKLVARLDRELCDLAHCTIVCSQHLFDLKTGVAKRLELVANGVDVAHYSSVSDASLPSHPLTKSWEKPVLGYTGSIHPDRVDVELVAALAQAFPDATVALVGPNMLPEPLQKRLSTLANIVFTDAVPYFAIPDVMRAFDVCITPHLETDFTQSLNPIKLWEYLASGKPIVATNVAGFRDYTPLVKIASGASDFIAACREALLGDDLAAERQKIAAQNSWEARLDQIDAILESVVRPIPS